MFNIHLHAVLLIRSTSFFQISCFLFFRVFSDLLLLKMLLKFSKKPGAKRGSNHLQNTLINLILTKNYNSHNNTEWKTKKLDMEEFVSSTTTKQLHRFLLNSECFLFSKAEIWITMSASYIFENSQICFLLTASY